MQFHYKRLHLHLPDRSNPNGKKKSSIRRIIERQEQQQQLQLEINAQQRWQQTHGGITSQSFIPRSRAGSVTQGQLENEGEDTVKRTATIIIEDSYEAAINKARAFENHQLQGLLRSVLPEEGP